MVIKVVNLSKNYVSYQRKGIFRTKKIINALSNVNIEISENTTIGLIGLNGAGKSTLIKILSGILKPTSGTVMVFGRDPLTNRKKNAFFNTVIFGQRSQLRWDISANDYFKLLKEIYLIDDVTFNKRLNNYIEFFDAKKIINQPVRTLSLGQKMRMEFIAAFLHEPKLIFLDEPTIGLDYVTKRLVLEFLKHYKTNNKATIILTSHDLDLIETLSDRVIILKSGKVAYDGSFANLSSKFDRIYTAHVVFRNNKNIIIEDVEYIIKNGIYEFRNIPLSKLRDFVIHLFTNNEVEDFKISNGGLELFLNNITESTYE